MVISAKVCGDYSSRFGRKLLFLIGLFSVSVRCAVLVLLITIRDHQGESNIYIQALILSTQIFDGIGAGVFGTMYILATFDISGGTGWFSLTLGITTAAMSIGGTISGYLGEMLAEDFGYHAAFGILGIMSLVPALLYLFIMPETLPNYNEQFIGMSHKHNNYKPNNSKPINPILSLASINEHHKEDDAAMEDHEFH
jgi:MFS family permease